MREYLAGSGHADLFDRVHADIRQLLPARGVWEAPGRTGIGFQLTEPDDPKVWKTYFGVYAGYRGSVCSISMLPASCHRRFIGVGAPSCNDSGNPSRCMTGRTEDTSATSRLKASGPSIVALVLEFVSAVMASRSGGDNAET